jgi:hypothetical protein
MKLMSLDDLFKWHMEQYLKKENTKEIRQFHNEALRLLADIRASVHKLAFYIERQDKLTH